MSGPPVYVGREVHVAGTDLVRQALLAAAELSLAIEKVRVPPAIADAARHLREVLAALQRSRETADTIGRACYAGEHQR